MDRRHTVRTSLALAISVIVAFFPWFLEFDGQIAGTSVSLRALGNSLGIAISLLGLCILLSRRLRNKMELLTAEFDALSPGIKKRLIWFGTFVYIAGTTSHKLRAHHHLSTHAQDLGVFSNICWNLSQGHGCFSSFYGIDFLGIHANLILWPLSALYWIGGDARMLLFVQSLFVGLSIPFLWRVAERATNSFTLASLICVMFVSARCVGELVENDFHPDVWVVPTTMAALWAWQKGSKGGVLLFGSLSLLAKEDACVTMAGFALVLLFFPGWRKTGAGLLAICFGVFLFYMQVLIPAHTPDGAQSLLFFRYTFGHSYEEWIRNLIHHPELYFEALCHHAQKYSRVGIMLFPTLGLPFLSPVLLVPAAISILPHLLSQHPTQLSLGDIYVTHAQPYLFVAAAFGLARLLSFSRIEPYKNAVIGLCLVSAGVNAVLSPRYYKKQTLARIEAFREVKRLIPPTASLAAQQNLYAHFDCRKNVQLFPIRATEPNFRQRLMKNPDYVLFDLIGNTSPFPKESLIDDARTMKSNPAYRTIFEKQYFVLMQRVDNEKLVYRATRR